MTLIYMQDSVPDPNIIFDPQENALLGIVEHINSRLGESPKLAKIIEKVNKEYPIYPNATAQVRALRRENGVKTIGEYF